MTDIERITIMTVTTVNTCRACLKIIENMLKEPFEIIISGHIVPQRALEAGARFQACSSLPPTLPRAGPIAPP